MDATGNWDSLTTNGTAQARTHDKQNRTTAVGATAVTYDGNGSVTKDDNNITLRYEAWGQQVEAKVGSTSYAVYRYDAVGRTIQRGSYKRYYSDRWQVLWAEGVTGTNNESASHVWSPVYVDALVLHDRDIGLNGVDSRWYAAQDANYNVTSVTDRTGAVLEREAYDAYGKIGYLAPDFSARASSSIQTFVWGYQGLRLDGATGAWHARNRELSPTLGRFTRQDPIGCADGANLYQFVRGRPIGWRDPLGTSGVSDCLAGYKLCTSGVYDNPTLMQCQKLRDTCLKNSVSSFPLLPNTSCECNKYKPGDDYAWANAKCFCKKAGNDPWSKYVRGCLRALYDAGETPDNAHAACYALADANSGESMPVGKLLLTYASCFTTWA